MGKGKTPRIRFKGFTDDWEQRKLGEVLSPLKNNTLSRSELNDGQGTIQNIHYGDVLIKFGEYLDVKKEEIPFVNPSVMLSNIDFLQNGDIIFADTAEDATVGKCTEISGINGRKVVSGLHTMPFRPVIKFADGYLGFYLNSSAYHDQLVPLMQGIKVTSISKSALHDTLLTYPPDRKEQSRLGGFFIHLDHLIALHQRKLDKLKITKNFMLENMFPKNGEKRPRIRFSGFTDDWEQRKLSDVVEVYDGVHQTPDYQELGIMFLSVENIATLTSNKFISEEAFERDYKYYPEKGDILMTRIGDVGTPNVVETDEKVAFYVSLALLKPRNIDSYFLCNAIRSPEFQKGLRERTLVTAIPQKINKDEIGKVEFFIPKKSDEQKAIGNYFKSLDNLIALHQRKLDKIKKIKQSMLEKMFV